MTFDKRTIFDSLAATATSRRGIYVERENALLLVPHSTGWPVSLTISGAEADLLTGTGTRVGIDDEVPSNNGAVIEVVEAIMDGNAEEYFRFGDGSGSFEVCGHRIWYGAGSARQALDDGVVPDATLRAQPW